MLQKLSALILVIFFVSAAFAQHHMTNTVGYADSVNSGLIPADTMKGSPHRINMANIGPSHVHIEYGSPGVKGRVIWGGLVPWDKIWVTGANNATIISFGKDVIWGGKPIPAGIYGFFTIPGKDKWVLILNKNSEMHLTDDYDEKNDVARIEVKPTTLPKSVPRLSYIVRETGKSKGEVIMQWEKIEIKIPVTVK